jgi:hypothetical protein
MLLSHGKTGHLCLCVDCCDEYDYKIKGCPMCRMPVDQAVQVFGA